MDPQPSPRTGCRLLPSVRPAGEVLGGSFVERSERRPTAGCAFRDRRHYHPSRRSQAFMTEPTREYVRESPPNAGGACHHDDDHVVAAYRARRPSDSSLRAPSPGLPAAPRSPSEQTAADRILEFGVGAGTRALYDRAHVVGIDLSRDMLERREARRRGPTAPRRALEVINASTSSSPTPPSTRRWRCS